MKTKSLLPILFISFFISSCAPTSFFQVYKAEPVNDITVKDDVLTYEDDNCIVTYHFWGDGGDIGFRFYNKTDDDIYLNLDECYFILNGSAFNYYQNREYTYSKDAGVSSAGSGSASAAVTGINQYGYIQTNRLAATSTTELMASRGYAVTYTEEKDVCIPAKTSKVISEYLINNTLFRDCDLYRFPSSKEINTIKFTKEDSPLVFSNRITYEIGESGNSIDFENEFYVTEITNYPESEFTEYSYQEYCGQKSISRSKYFKDVSANKFYIYYKKSGIWEH